MNIQTELEILILLCLQKTEKCFQCISFSIVIPNNFIQLFEKLCFKSALRILTAISFLSPSKKRKNNSYKENIYILTRLVDN